MIKYSVGLILLSIISCTTISTPRSIVDPQLEPSKIKEIYIVKNLQGYNRLNSLTFQKANHLLDSALINDFRGIGISVEISEDRISEEQQSYLNKLKIYYDNRRQRRIGLLNDSLAFPSDMDSFNQDFLILLEVEIVESAVCDSNRYSCIDITNYINKVRAYLIDTNDEKVKWFQVFNVGYVKHSEIVTDILDYDIYSRGLAYNLNYGTDLNQNSFKIMDSKRLLILELNDGEQVEGYIKNSSGFSINFLNSTGTDSLTIDLNDISKAMYSDEEVVFPIHHY